MPKSSFYQLDESSRAFLLESRRDAGSFAHKLEGFSGTIYVFDGGEYRYPRYTCAKVPKLSALVDAKEATRRFLREMKLQRQMQYSSFVHWPFEFDFVLDAPVAWFRLWHTDLSHMISDTSFSTGGRLSVLAYLVSGMMHCHRKGLVAHQDFKPENIFVRNLRRDFSGFPKEDVFSFPMIADFGSANLASEKGIYRGTRPYMAPEQWSEQPLGQHTTAWSFGILIYELLTSGLHPIGESTQPWRHGTAPGRWQKNDMWRRWIAGGGMPKQPLPDLEMDRFVRRCLSKDASERPKLEEIQVFLLQQQEKITPALRLHTEFQIARAGEDSNREHKWAYLDERYEKVTKVVCNYFDEDIRPEVT